MIDNYQTMFKKLYHLSIDQNIYYLNLIITIMFNHIHLCL